MAKDYMELLSEYHQGVRASCLGDSGVYSNISWIDTAVTQATLDSDYIELLKAKKRIAIDARTGELISAGFPFDGKTFSLSLNAQKNWLGIKTLADMITWPMNITTIDDCEYTLAEVDIDTFIGTAQYYVQMHLDSGRALKVAVNDATTEAAVNAVVDNR